MKEERETEIRDKRGGIRSTADVSEKLRHHHIDSKLNYILVFPCYLLLPLTSCRLKQCIARDHVPPDQCQ